MSRNRMSRGHAIYLLILLLCCAIYLFPSPATCTHLLRTLGFLAKKQGVSVDDVASASITLAFITYPSALVEV